MNKETFIAKHGPEWKKFEFSDMGQDFFRLVEASSPAKSIPIGEDKSNLRLVGAPVLLNEIAGYEILVRLMRGLGIEPKPPVEAQEDTFEEPEL